jgi:hypothetical protein
VVRWPRIYLSGGNWGCTISKTGKARHIDYYPDEAIGGIAGKLNPAEFGMYWLICTLIYSHGGPIEDDTVRFSRLLNCDPRTTRALVDRLISTGKVVRVGTEITVRRCLVELERASRRMLVARENGLNGGRPSKKNKDLEKPRGLFFEKLTNQLPTTNLPTNNPHSPQGGNGSAKVAIALFEKEFEEIFWPVVWVKDGKRPAKIAFVKARAKATLEEIMAGAERYRERLSGIDPPKPKYPQGWLNDERWTDGAIITHEIPEPRRPTGPPPPIDGG